MIICSLHEIILDVIEKQNETEELTMRSERARG
jgi:hypothetical protein